MENSRKVSSFPSQGKWLVIWSTKSERNWIMKKIFIVNVEDFLLFFVDNAISQSSSTALLSLNFYSPKSQTDKSKILGYPERCHKQGVKHAQTREQGPPGLLSPKNIRIPQKKIRDSYFPPHYAIFGSCWCGAEWHRQACPDREGGPHGVSGNFSDVQCVDGQGLRLLVIFSSCLVRGSEKPAWAALGRAGRNSVATIIGVFFSFTYPPQNFTYPPQFMGHILVCQMGLS